MAKEITKSRDEIVKLAKKYAGAKQGSKKHKELVDTFNKKKPHKEVGNYCCPWCAISWTAWNLMVGNTDKQVPMSYNCGTLISDAKALGIWQEDDNYLPQPGDGIIYYWSDSGKGDCKCGASHVGLITEVHGSEITVIEGNMSTYEKVGYRTIYRNQRYIRGYIAPKYKKNIKASRKITVDGIWGPDTIKLTQHIVGVEEDGIAGPKTWTAIQKQCGLTGKKVTGKPGKQTYSAMESLTGAKQTMKLDKATVKAWQKWLNKQVD